MINIMLWIFYHNLKRSRFHIKIWIAGFSLKEKNNDIWQHTGSCFVCQGLAEAEIAAVFRWDMGSYICCDSTTLPCHFYCVPFMWPGWPPRVFEGVVPGPWTPISCWAPLASFCSFSPCFPLFQYLAGSRKEVSHVGRHSVCLHNNNQRKRMRVCLHLPKLHSDLTRLLTVDPEWS